MENRWLNKPTAGSALTMKHLVEDKELGVGGVQSSTRGIGENQLSSSLVPEWVVRGTRPYRAL